MDIANFDFEGKYVIPLFDLLTHRDYGNLGYRRGFDPKLPLFSQEWKHRIMFRALDYRREDLVLRDDNGRVTGVVAWLIVDATYGDFHKHYVKVVSNETSFFIPEVETNSKYYPLLPSNHLVYSHGSLEPLGIGKTKKYGYNGIVDVRKLLDSLFYCKTPWRPLDFRFGTKESTLPDLPSSSEVRSTKIRNSSAKKQSKYEGKTAAELKAEILKPGYKPGSTQKNT